MKAEEAEARAWIRNALATGDPSVDWIREIHAERAARKRKPRTSWQRFIAFMFD